MNQTAKKPDSGMAVTLMEAREALWLERHALFERARLARIENDLAAAGRLWVRIEEMSAQIRQADEDIEREAS